HPVSAAWDAWDRTRNDATLVGYRPARDAFVEVMLREVAGWGDLLEAGDGGIRAYSPNRAVEVAPTAMLTHGGERGALVLVVDPVDSLRTGPGDGWAAGAVDRMEALLRAGGVRVGVVTDGRWWGLVHVGADGGADGLPASGVVDALTWVEEGRTRDAFLTLLDPGALVVGDAQTRLPELFAQSTLRAEDVTVSLGVQVRRAVELLVAAFSEAGARAGEDGAPDPLPDGPVIYDAAVTVMMRVVFLLFAQERGLLPETALFADAYGLAGCLDDLDARALAEHEESLDGTTEVWHRLMATSRLLHQGSSFEDLRMPSYGGSLFDPARFAFLAATAARGLAVRVSDRVMLHVLRSVQVAVVDGDARRLSFRDIDVEQIGYIYEGLLGYSARVVDEVHVGLVGQRSARGLAGEEPEIALARLEEYAAGAPTTKALAERLLADIKEEQPGAKPPSVSALTTALDAVPAQAESLLRLIAPHDAALRDRLRPFLGAVRLDLRERPVVVAPGGLLVVETPSRRNAGAHYTPKALAEEVVTHALAPLVYSPGPHDTADATAWRLRRSEDLLGLKVADIACGSGAFLVAAARYLADRVVEAWRLQGSFADLTEGEAKVTAIRKVVASCLYGADINPMAVEMCKLSLWLVSLDRGLPFSFVDDKVLHGNSLLGLTEIRQLERLHIAPSAEGERGYVQEGMTFSAADNALVHVFETVGLGERMAAA
ncbi:MAG: N-6 DNA methylase, partial [Phycicoccus sp.]